MNKDELEEVLIVGASIQIGKQYAEAFPDFTEGQIITLIDGTFEYDNGLYTENQDCPSIWNVDEFDSIYHLFGNNFEYFYDCRVLPVTTLERFYNERIYSEGSPLFHELTTDQKEMLEGMVSYSFYKAAEAVRNLGVSLRILSSVNEKTRIDGN